MAEIAPHIDRNRAASGLQTGRKRASIGAAARAIARAGRL